MLGEGSAGIPGGLDPMSALIPLALFGAIPLAIGLFATFPARRALITFFVSAWLFLPVSAIEIPMLPPYDKRIAASLSGLLAIVLFQPRSLWSVRPGWVDMPMALWCATPFMTALSNNMGLHEALSSSFQLTVVWGLPYWFGRIFIRDMNGARDLALGIIIGGAIYMFFCLWEVRMSPRLHLIVFGERQHSWSQVHRGGGYRPMVFQDHGLMLSFWMATCALLALWISWAKGIKRLGPFPMWAVAVALLGTTVLCKSLGAVGLLVGGLGALWASTVTRSRVLIGLLVLVPPVYCASRMTGVFTGSTAVELAGGVSARSATSLKFRLDNEGILIDHALRRPLLGWGRFARSNPRDPETGRYMATQDGQWIRTLGMMGLVGLFALMMIGITPVYLGMRALGVKGLRTPALAPFCALMIIIALYAIDNLLNAMANPIYMIVAGGVTSVALRGFHAPQSRPRFQLRGTNQERKSPEAPRLLRRERPRKNRRIPSAGPDSLHQAP